MLSRRALVPSIAAGLMLLAAGITPVAAEAQTSEQPPADYLDYGFKFASKLTVDPKDMTRVQESVVREMMNAGQLDRAEQMAPQIEGWRRGVALADLAAEYAKAGKKDKARKLLADAEVFQRTVTGWYGPRIQAHIADALAIIGEQERAKNVSGELAAADRPQYLGRTTAAVATAMAVAGDFEGAIEHLDSMESTTYDDSWFRAAGYAEIAQLQSVTKEQKIQALEAAWEAALKVPGWRAIEAFYVIGDEYAKLGEKKRARKSLDEVSQKLDQMANDHVAKSPLLAQTAVAYARIGDKKNARELIAQAEQVAKGAGVTKIEKPKFLGMAGMAYMANGDLEDAKRLFDEALDGAKGLVNARPRVMAVVDICRAMARHDYPVDASTRSRLDALYTGLKPPW